MKIHKAYIVGFSILLIILGFIAVNIFFLPPVHTINPKSPSALDTSRGGIPPGSKNPQLTEGQVQASDPEHVTLSKQDYEDFITILINNMLKRNEKLLPNEISSIEASERGPLEADLAGSIPATLRLESVQIRQLYLLMQTELLRWNQYFGDKYQEVLDGRVEPIVFDTEYLHLADPDNVRYFSELENALELHKKLIRDIRIFRAEVQFARQQIEAQQDYQPYALKSKLAPFARESGIADALLQAMSAVSAGIYPQEASDIISRLIEMYTEPVRRLHDSAVADNYNFNIYLLYGKKILEYADRLAGRPIVSPSAFERAEIDYVNRMLTQSFQDLYQAGRDERIGANRLDLVQLEALVN